MFTVEMLPAQRGDCLWLTYGEGDDRHHVLVDGGPQETIRSVVPELERRIAALPGERDRLELLIVTHVDADHIQGVVSLLSDPRRLRLFRDVWFNGFRHLGGPLLGGPDGERLTRLLLDAPERWNAAFGGEAVAIPPEGPPQPVRLAGGLTLTVLTPTTTALERLAPEWEETCRKAGILPGEGAELARASWRRDGLLGFDVDGLARSPYKRDPSRANATTISVIAEHGGKRVLLLGDAAAEDVIAGLDRLGPGPHRFAAVKLSHHGSRRNTNLALLERLRSRHWLVSTNGATFHHPDPETLARVIATQDRPVFTVNYVTEQLDDLRAQADARWSVRTPRRRRDGTYAEGVVHRVG